MSWTRIGGMEVQLQSLDGDERSTSRPLDRRLGGSHSPSQSHFGTVSQSRVQPLVKQMCKVWRVSRLSMSSRWTFSQISTHFTKCLCTRSLVSSGRPCTADYALFILTLWQ